jgi:hypothetical protein
MFAEAEAEAIRGRTAEQRALEYEQIGEDCQSEEPAVVQAARDIKGVSAPSGDTAIEPLLASPAVARRPAWQYITGIVLAGVVLACSSASQPQRAGAERVARPVVSTVYGWFGATITPRWDLDRVRGETTRAWKPRASTVPGCE